MSALLYMYANMDEMNQYFMQVQKNLNMWYHVYFLVP
jgi:hypothetical protein